MKKLLLALFCCWLTQAGAAASSACAYQNATTPPAFSLSGRITNHIGAPLPGAVITVKGTSNLATTNSVGSFLLAVEQADPVLVITCVGYQPQTLVAKTRNNLSITLYPIGTVAPLAASTTAARADDATATVANPNLVVADVQPTYPGGVAAYREYLRLNAKYPEAAKSYSQPASVYVTFNVDEAGRILDAQVVKGVGFGFDEEAVRLVRLMPWWNPALVAGKPVKMACTLRINFTPPPPPIDNPNNLVR